jgi:hypothetical protein
MDDDELSEWIGLGEGGMVMPSAPWLWRRIPMNALRATASFLASVSDDIAASINYKLDRDDFREEAALEIETLTESKES